MRKGTKLLRIVSILLVLLSLVWPCGAETEMKTHSLKAPGATLTVVHYSAPW
jgi:hypothetical protein